MVEGSNSGIHFLNSWTHALRVIRKTANYFMGIIEYSVMGFIEDSVCKELCTEDFRCNVAFWELKDRESSCFLYRTEAEFNKDILRDGLGNIIQYTGSNIRETRTFYKIVNGSSEYNNIDVSI